ncbi:CHAT domain-containing protein [Nonomuraea wenchangensis]
MPAWLFARAPATGYGSFIRPPTARDRGVRLLHVLWGAAPIGIAFAGPSPSPWTIGLALLISVQVWWFDHLIQRLPRYSQPGGRISAIVMTGGVCALAATPVGGWAVGLWRAVPGPAWLVGGIVLVALVTVIRVPPRQGSPNRLIRVLLPVLTVLDQLLRRGLFPYAAVVAFHPAVDLLPGVALLVCAEFALMCLGAVAGEVSSLQSFLLSMIFRLTFADRLLIIASWLYDGLLARPGRPDYSFVSTLTGHAALSSMGRAPFGQGFLAFDLRAREPMTEERALDWVKIAEAAVGLAELEVLPRCPPEHLARLRRDQARARQSCHTTRALLYQYLNWRDSSIAEWLAVADLAEEAQAPNNATLGRCNAALILGVRLGRPRDALATMNDGLDLATLAAPMRRYSLIMMALFHMLLGEVEESRSLIDRARAVPLDRAGWAAMRAEEVSRSPFVRSRTMRRVMSKMLAVQESFVRSAAYGEPFRGEFPREFALAPGLTEYMRAYALLFEERYPEAKRALTDAHARAAAAGHLTWSYSAALGLADLAVMEDDIREGYRLLRGSIGMLEEMRGRVIDADLRIGAGAEPNANPYERAALLLVTSDLADEVEGAAVEAFELAERARSRVFIELLGGVTEQVVPPELHELAAAELAAAEEFERALLDGDGERVRDLGRDLDAARQALRRSGPAGAEYADLREGRPVSLAEVRRLLGDDVVLGEYLVTDFGTLLFLVRADHEEPEVVALDVTRGGLRAAAEDLRVFSPGSPPLWQGAFRALLEPLAEACQEGQRVCLVPHDLLHIVPLHAVEIDGRPFGARNPVSYLPSASTLRYCRRTGTAPATATWSQRRLVVLADSRADQPLVHARIQSAAIAGLFSRDAEALIGEQVTRAAIEARSADVWHVACHGEFDDRELSRSGILLADGRLSAADLLSMRLDCDLVTLSACQTGLSALATGDELIGLTRALIYAGAASAVVSLWPVDEISTSIMMEEFYRGLMAGQDKAAALSRAQERVQTLTAREAIAYCEQAAGDPDALALAWDIADLRAQAGDLAVAADAYTALASRFPRGTSEQRRLTAAATRSRRAARNAPPPDYGTRPYAHPYYWAAFIVVGDWQ